MNERRSMYSTSGKCIGRLLGQSMRMPNAGPDCPSQGRTPVLVQCREDVDDQAPTAKDVWTSRPLPSD